MANEIDLSRLGHTIRFLRQGRGWSLADLAEKSGVSKAYLSDLENGSAGKPNIQYVFSVAKALETTLDRLLMGPTAVAPARSEEPSSIPLPQGLADLQAEYHLSDDEVERLAAINYRGNRPRDVQGWRYLLQTLKMLGQKPSGKPED